MSGEKDLLRVFMDELRRIPLMTREEEIVAGLRAKAGDMEARNKLVAANLRFAVSMAFRYLRQDIPAADLVSAACMGLFIASQKNDPLRGVRFLTYAVYHIKKEILRLIITSAKHSSIFLNDEVTFQDRTADMAAERAFDDKTGSIEVEQLLSSVSRLTERERNIINMRFFQDMNFKEVAHALGLSGAQAQQIERRALLKLRRFLCQEGAHEEKKRLQKRAEIP